MALHCSVICDFVGSQQVKHYVVLIFVDGTSYIKSKCSINILQVCTYAYKIM